MACFEHPNSSAKGDLRLPFSIRHKTSTFWATLRQGWDRWSSWLVAHQRFVGKGMVKKTDCITHYWRQSGRYRQLNSRLRCDLFRETLQHRASKNWKEGASFQTGDVRGFQAVIWHDVVQTLNRWFKKLGETGYSDFRKNSWIDS